MRILPSNVLTKSNDKIRIKPARIMSFGLKSWIYLANFSSNCAFVENFPRVITRVGMFAVLALDKPNASSTLLITQVIFIPISSALSISDCRFEPEPEIRTTTLDNDLFTIILCDRTKQPSVFARRVKMGNYLFAVLCINHHYHTHTAVEHAIHLG